MTVTEFPFAGVVLSPPYPTSGLSTKRWIREVPLAVVLFRDLWLTQDGIHFTTLFGIRRAASANDTMPHVISYGGKMFLEDGHHRVTCLALAGRQGVWARVFAVGGSNEVSA